MVFSNKHKSTVKIEIRIGNVGVFFVIKFQNGGPNFVDVSYERVH